MVESGQVRLKRSTPFLQSARAQLRLLPIRPRDLGSPVRLRLGLLFLPAEVSVKPRRSLLTLETGSKRVSGRAGTFADCIHEPPQASGLQRHDRRAQGAGRELAGTTP